MIPPRPDLLKEGSSWRCRRALLAILGCGLAAMPMDAAERFVWQPVQRYLIRRQGDAQPVSGTRRLNSFTNYTHLGTDFGFHGAAQHEIEWVRDEVSVHLGQQPDVWAGMWHSLAGRAVDTGRVMDFRRVYPAPLAAKRQPRVTALRIDAKGRGAVKLEVKNAAGEVRWSQIVPLTEDGGAEHRFELKPEEFPDAKQLIWTAEPGSEVTVSGLYLGVTLPEMPWDEYVFLASYAKLLRCHNAATGYVRDRAHLPEGAFESVPATGLFVLATAAAAQEPLGVVTRDFARKCLLQTHAAMMRLRRSHGLLPHFVWRVGKEHFIHPNTEYSSIDTALYAQCVLLAARMLGENALEAQILDFIRQIDFQALKLPSGHCSHGTHQDGERVLPHGWADWGGETALVNLLQRLADPRAPIARATHPGRAWQGTGFITEIQSLLYEDFDQDRADALDGVNWLGARRFMWQAQANFFPARDATGFAARKAVYGLSAGENEFGNAYYVGGVDLPDQRLIHPHYLLMSATVSPRPGEALTALQNLEEAGFFPPWGLVENFTQDGGSHLAMDGGLNASFESLGAFHLLMKLRGLPNPVYEAGRGIPALRQAMRLYFEETSAAGSGTAGAN